jgi:hypothetical protein
MSKMKAGNASTFPALSVILLSSHWKKAYTDIMSNTATLVKPVTSVFYDMEMERLSTFQQQTKELIVIKKDKQRLTASLDIYVDTEYVQQLDNNNMMLTTQAVLKDKTGVCLEHPLLNVGRLPSWKEETIFPTLLGLKEAVYNKRNKNILTIKTHIFFAPADILAGLMSRSKALKLQQDMKQDGRITLLKKHGAGDILTAVYIDGNIFNIKIEPIDYGKLFGIKGLAATSEALGIPMLAKGAMDGYKENMLVPYLDDELFPLFREYAMDDAIVLTSYRQQKDAVDAELFDVQGLKPERSYNTPGSLVSGIQLGYLEQHCGDGGRGWEAMATTDDKGRSKPWKLKDLTRLSTTGAMAQKDGRAPLLALVQGGRAKNNIPSRCRYDGVIADLDASGFYAVGQRLCPYPLGFPAIYNTSTAAGAKRLTLGAFLDKLGDDLYPRCFSIVVSGTLPFFQSLVHSKMTTAADIKTGYDPEDPDVDAPFLLLSHEIQNGIITSDVWDALQHVCSSKELKGFKDLIVETAMFYRSRYRFTDATLWAEAMQKHVETKGHGTEYKLLGNGFNDGDALDISPPFWLDVSMAPFIDVNNKARQEKKAERDIFPEKTDKWNALNVLQDNIKLVNNTAYGVQASAFFDVANVCFANNVTAMGRTCIWLASRTLGGHQDITDGFIYSLDNVLMAVATRPSMETLTLRYHPDMLSRKAQQSIKTGHLLGAEASLHKADNGMQTLTAGTFLETAGKEHFVKLDAIAEQHVKTFWTKASGACPTCLEMFNVSHKNVYQGGAYRGQTDYGVIKADDTTMDIKARGHKLDKARYWDSVAVDDNEMEQGCCVATMEMSQMSQLLYDIDETPNNVRIPKAQKTSIILKINAANKMATASITNVFKENELLAGDSIIKNVQIRPISLSMFCYRTAWQHSRWTKGNERLMLETGYGIEQYFLNADGTFRYQAAIAAIDKAILEGQSWDIFLKQLQDS